MFAKRQVMLTAVTLALLMNIGVDAHATAQEAADAIISKVNRASRRLDNHAKTDTACDAALAKANTLTGEAPENCNVKQTACPANCTALFTNMNEACYGKGVEDSEKKVEMYNIGLNAAALEIFLDEGVCKDAPSVAALKSKHLTCQNGIDLMSSQAVFTCGSSDDGTAEVCTNVCKQTIDKVYEICDSTDVSTNKDGTKTSIEVLMTGMESFYSKDCVTYLGTKKFKDTAAPSPVGSTGSSTHVLSTVLMGAAISAATYML